MANLGALNSNSAQPIFARIYSDINFSFTALSSTEDVAKVININSVKQSLMTLINTRFGERLFQPDVGSPMFSILFEPIDPITTITLQQAISQVIQNNEPRVVLTQPIGVIPSSDESSYTINIYFTIVGIASPITFSIILQRLR